MKRVLLAGVAVLALTAAASAADLTMEPAPMAPVVAPAAFDWSGFYVGVHGGGAWGDFSTNIWQDAFGNASSVLGGVQAGYNYQINQVVLGVQTDLAYTNLTTGQDVIPGLVGVNANLNWLGSTTVRAGYAIDTWLPYVKGGFAYGETKANIDSLVFSDSKWATGWTVGAGLEKAFTKNITGFAEYDYFDLGSAAYDISNAIGTIELKNTTNVVKVGLNYKF
ncbi:outer membrane immunogenic protein [Kaistia soli DSM 19436]|uniref:Outer membrane immunogenic protein n=1 Tax=Kaistia soli DSM 19436 TaxID=1122133 RepID=A0A1M5KA77_9HYPH|nr:outer membrane protein [Kaistia soli]SHG49093.1 outer membrane immunogenic protein [Kaistia soli DSM 19436]